MKVKASHSHKGPYDFDLLVPVQELTSQKMVSSVMCFCICIFTGGKKTVTVGESKRCCYTLTREFTKCQNSKFRIRLVCDSVMIEDPTTRCTCTLWNIWYLFD